MKIYKYGKEIEIDPLLSAKDNLDNFFPINFGKIIIILYHQMLKTF